MLAALALIAATFTWDARPETPAPWYRLYRGWMELAWIPDPETGDLYLSTVRPRFLRCDALDVSPSNCAAGRCFYLAADLGNALELTFVTFFWPSPEWESNGCDSPTQDPCPKAYVEVCP